jgi:prolyl-tRNA editing enzyme YbaK/EbsC (Cys-tRNA(Pro) deacylase)
LTIIGCDIAEIAKSIIFRTKKTNQPVLVIASGRNRINEKQIAAYIGEQILRADADFVRDATGFAIGGIPPFGHKNKIPHIFIDHDLVNFEVLWAAAGTPNSVFRILPKDLVKMSEGQITNIN